MRVEDRNGKKVLGQRHRKKEENFQNLQRENAYQVQEVDGTQIDKIRKETPHNTKKKKSKLTVQNKAS